MKKQPDTFIGLLRGINVSGRNKIPMVELRSVCADIGWSDVQTYIQSGNLVFKATGNPADLEAQLETEIARHFGLSISVIVRPAADWPAYLEDNPFRSASEKEPNLVILALSKAPPKPEAVERLRERADNDERITQVGDALWFHYARGIAMSKLSPALLDRFVGSPVTGRNWRTVLKLDEMARESASEK